MTRVAALALIVLLLAGCGTFVAPTARPAGELLDVVNGLVLRNMTVTGQTAGDPGCSSQASALHSNAVRYDVRPPGDVNSYPIYVFNWKSEAAFNADRAAFQACVQAEDNLATASVDTVEHLPWRAFGPGWPPAVRDAVDAALSEAGGVPAPPAPQ
jgi:hypothetical protein